MKRRSPLFWLLLAAFIAGVAWWSVHVPYTPERLYRAIPAEATALSAHYNLAGRWDALCTNPVVQGVTAALDIDPVALQIVGQDDATRSILQMLASRETLFAYVPELRATGEPAWVFASWVGGDGQRLRWMLSAMKLQGLQRGAGRDGWPVWVWKPRGMRSEQLVTFAIVEGMVVGCVAAQTDGIEEVLNGMDGHSLSMADRPESIVAEPTVHPDRGWIRLRGPGGRELEPLSYAFDLASSGGIRGTVTAPFVPAVSGSVSAVTSAEDVAGLVGDLPIACAVLDRSLSRVWLQRVLTNAVAREVGGLMRGDSPGTLTLGVLGGPYSGRLMAVRVPTIVAGLTVTDASEALAEMNSAFDRLNAATRWGLVPQLVMMGTQRVYAIEGTGHSVYASVETKERIAYTALGGSLVFGSNLEILAKLIGEQNIAGPRAGSRLADGVRRMRDRQAMAYAWVDLVEGGKVARLAITAWSLKLLVESPARTQALRQRLNIAKAWIDALAPFQQLQVWVRPRGEVTEFEFVAGGT